jgi:hypothetical protein
MIKKAAQIQLAEEKEARLKAEQEKARLAQEEKARILFELAESRNLLQAPRHKKSEK